MAKKTAPFSAFEWLIAWRYLRAKRAEGGVSVMTWISLIGITLAVFALIAVMAVRAGFRTELMDTIRGADGDVLVYAADRMDESGQTLRGFADYDELATAIRAIPGVTRAVPQIRGQVMASDGRRNRPGDVYGVSLESLQQNPRIANGEKNIGNLEDFDKGIALGGRLATALGVTVGDRIRLVSPNGVKTPMGTAPRQKAYEVVYIFSAGRTDLDELRIYMPFTEAQSFFDREGYTDEIEVLVNDPERIDSFAPEILNAAGPSAMVWTWKDRAGDYLNALRMEDNVMFIIMSILVLIASLNIVSGLIMLVKNKGRDIGILRTMGVTQGSVMRIFFICGASVGLAGTLAGVALGTLFAVNLDHVLDFLNYMSGENVLSPEVRGIYTLTAQVNPANILAAMALSLGLSFVVTIFPARRAARMNPVEALRYE